MAEIKIDREAYELLKAGQVKEFGDDSRLASFLANKFEEGEAQAQTRSQDTNWVYNIWSFVF